MTGNKNLKVDLLKGVDDGVMTLRIISPSWPHPLGFFPLISALQPPWSKQLLSTTLLQYALPYLSSTAKEAAN